jgi:hypothetical protein
METIEFEYENEDGDLEVVDLPARRRTDLPHGEDEGRVT